jgi:hypothetical protein
MGKRLRRFLVAEVLPKLRRGEPVLPAGAVASAPPLLPPKPRRRRYSPPPFIRIETAERLMQHAPADLLKFQKLGPYSPEGRASYEAVNSGMVWTLSTLAILAPTATDPAVIARLEALAVQVREIEGDFKDVLGRAKPPAVAPRHA